MRAYTVRRIGVALALAVISAIPQPRGALGQAAGWRQVVDRDHTVSIQVPPDWQVSEPGTPAVLAASSDRDVSVNVVLERLPYPMAVRDYAARGSAGERRVLHRFTVLDTRQTRIAGQPVVTQDYAWVSNAGVTLAGSQLMEVNGTLGLVATGTWRAASPQAAHDRAIARQILESVRVLAASPVGRHTGHSSAASGGRRDLFALPPGVAPAGSTVPSVAPPPMPVPEAPGPLVPPGGLPALPGQGQGHEPQAPPVALGGIALGATPQAVLVSGTSYKIVATGQDTPWGTVRAITATTVTFETTSGSRTLTFEAKPAATNNTPPGSY